MAAALRPGDVVRIRGARWRVARYTPYAQAGVLDVEGCDRDNRCITTRFVTPFEQVDPLPSAAAPRVVRMPRWRRLACGLLATVVPSYGSLRAAAAGDFSILPFQLEPALAVASGMASCLLIADAVGLGKTVQAALIIAEVLGRSPSDGRALVVCPAGLREQWQHELRSRFGLDANVLDSAAMVASAACGANPWAMHPVVVTSIDYVKRPEVMRGLETLVWDVAVFDEAHALSGRSDRHNAAAALADRCRLVVMLSATPHSGDDEAFQRLTSIGRFGGRFQALVFRRTRQDTGLALPRRTRWAHIRPTEIESRMHAGLMAYAQIVWRRNSNSAAGASLAMGVLIRRACSSAASLASSIERRLSLLENLTSEDHQPGLPFGPDPHDDEEPAAELGAPGLGDSRSESRILTEVLDLARSATARESKIEALRRLLQRVREPVIVFTQYRDTLARLDAALAGFAPVCLHGGLTIRERGHVLRAFTTGGARLLLATDAASEGLNLQQRCRAVIHLELPWTPLRLEQRVGRVDRIGQTRRVHSINLIASGTDEETTVLRLWSRLRHATQVLDAMRERTSTSGVDRAACPSADATGDPEGAILPSGLAAPALRAAAEREAERINRARQMRAQASHAPELRPVVAHAGLRSARPRSLWLIRLEYSDDRDRPVWDGVIGLRASEANPVGCSCDAVRAWFLDVHGRVLTVTGQEERRLLELLTRDVHAALSLSRAREQAIATELNARHARMAAALIQPGLFDRRHEREAGAQAAILNDALARCTARLDDLAALQRLSLCRRVAAMAALIG